MERHESLQNGAESIFTKLREVSELLAAHRALLSQLLPELVVCETCDAKVDGVGNALRAGWTEIVHQEASTWEFIGTCPDCMRENAE